MLYHSVVHVEEIFIFSSKKAKKNEKQQILAETMSVYDVKKR